MDPALPGATEAAVPPLARWMLLFHVLGVIVFLGGSLGAARLLGILGRQEEAARSAAAALARRVYLSLTLPGGILFLVTGLHLAFSDPWHRDYFHRTWFIMKITLAAAILMVDHLLVMRPLKGLAKGTGESAGHAALGRAGFWLLGLLVFALLTALFVVRP